MDELSDDSQEASCSSGVVDFLQPMMAWQHIHFKFEVCHLLGITEKCVFVMLELSGVYNLVYATINDLFTTPSPFRQVREKLPYKTAWSMYPEEFPFFLGGCAFRDSVCIVTQEKAMALNPWHGARVYALNAAFKSVIKCDMNDTFLAILGHTRNEDKRMVVLMWKWETMPIIDIHAYESIQSITLSKDSERADRLYVSRTDTEAPVLLYKIEHPHEFTEGMFRVLDNDDKNDAWALVKERTMVMLRDDDLVTIIREPSVDVLIHANKNAVAMFSTTSGLRHRKYYQETSIVDVQYIRELGVAIIHDSDNNVRIFDSLERELWLIDHNVVMRPFQPAIIQRDVPSYTDSFTGKTLSQFVPEHKGFFVFLQAGSVITIKL